MNYNEYDGNGNKNRIDLMDIMTDKTKRARFILFVSFILLLILVIVLRTNNKKMDESIEREDDSKVIEKNEKTEEKEDNYLKEEFSNLELNNYEFEFILNYNNSIYKYIGKRYNDNLSFILINDNNKRNYLGIMTEMKSKLEGEEEFTKTELPYVYINYFNNELLKKIIEKSTIEDDGYKISNDDLLSISDLAIDKKLKNDTDNVLDLILKNNKVVEIDIDFSSFVSEIENKEIIAKIELKYNNFGLIEAFSPIFE